MGSNVYKCARVCFRVCVLCTLFLCIGSMYTHMRMSVCVYICMSVYVFGSSSCRPGSGRVGEHAPPPSADSIALPRCYHVTVTRPDKPKAPPRHQWQREGMERLASSRFRPVWGEKRGDFFVFFRNIRVFFSF